MKLCSRSWRNSKTVKNVACDRPRTGMWRLMDDEVDKKKRKRLRGRQGGRKPEVNGFGAEGGSLSQDPSFRASHPSGPIRVPNLKLPFRGLFPFDALDFPFCGTSYSSLLLSPPLLLVQMMVEKAAPIQSASLMIRCLQVGWTRRSKSTSLIQGDLCQELSPAGFSMACFALFSRFKVKVTNRWRRSMLVLFLLHA